MFPQYCNSLRDPIQCPHSLRIHTYLDFSAAVGVFVGIRSCSDWLLYAHLSRDRLSCPTVPTETSLTHTHTHTRTHLSRAMAVME